MPSVPEAPFVCYGACFAPAGWFMGLVILSWIVLLVSVSFWVRRGYVPDPNEILIVNSAIFFRAWDSYIIAQVVF